MPRVITNIKDFETWKSAIDGMVVLKRFDRKGDLEDEIVRAHSQILLLPEERRLNQEMCVSADLDPFQNGMLSPVKLVEAADDYEDLQGNPNHLTEVDMRKLLANPKEIAGLEAAIAGVSNPTTLHRLLAIADDPEVDATVRQVTVINSRIRALAASSPAAYVEHEVISSSDGREVIGTNAPDSPAPRNPGMGRRSTVR